MIGRVFAIALNTFREAIRNKVLYGVLVVVIGANLFALVLGEMSLHEEARVVTDVGLAGVSLFGAITAILLGVSLLYNEIQKKTIHTILAKPIERYEFVLGKYFGMAMTLTCLVAVFACALAGLFALARLDATDVRWTSTITKAVALGYVEVLVVAAIAVLFSSFSSPYLSGIFTFALFFLGRAGNELRMAARSARDGWIRGVASAAIRIVPDLHMYAISGGVVEGKHVSVHADYVGWDYVGTATLYGLLWIALLLILAILSFRRRDFV